MCGDFIHNYGEVGCNKSLSMNILSLNARGIGQVKNRRWIKSLCFEHGISFLGVQETAMSTAQLFKIRSMWCNFGSSLLPLRLEVGRVGSFQFGIRQFLYRSLFYVMSTLFWSKVDGLLWKNRVLC